MNRLEQAKSQSVEETNDKIVEEEQATTNTDEPTEDSTTVGNELTEEESKIQELENHVSDLSNRLLRAQADYENFRRRSREEKEAAAKYRAQSLVEQLLPVLDNFDRALMIKPESEEAKSLLQGMEMVHRQLQEALIKEGVEIIQTIGQKFDPHLHQAIMQVESDEYESNHVVEELQKGYKLKDRVVRPAMVKVNA